MEQCEKVQFDEAVWVEENPQPHPEIRVMDMTPAQKKAHKAWVDAKRYARDPSVLERDKARKNKKYREDEAHRDARKEVERQRWENDPDTRLRQSERKKSPAYKKKARLSMVEKLKDPAYRDKKNKYQRSWHRANYKKKKDDPDFMSEMAAKRAKRRAAQDQRTPAWSDSDRINEIYLIAAQIHASTGFEYHVDHVVPLQGELVSGLHHQDNLRIVPGPENLSKSNKFKPGALPPRAGIRAARKLLKEIMDECRFTEGIKKRAGSAS